MSNPFLYFCTEFTPSSPKLLEQLSDFLKEIDDLQELLDEGFSAAEIAELIGHDDLAYDSPNGYSLSNLADNSLAQTIVEQGDDGARDPNSLFNKVMGLHYKENDWGGVFAGWLEGYEDAHEIEDNQGLKSFIWAFHKGEAPCVVFAADDDGYPQVLLSLMHAFLRYLDAPDTFELSWAYGSHPPRPGTYGGGAGCATKEGWWIGAALDLLRCVKDSTRLLSSVKRG